VAAELISARPPLVVSPLVLAELDHLIRTRQGDDIARRALRSLIGGRFETATLTQGDVAAALDVDARYPELGIGLTDATLVVLADRRRTLSIATLDERHFRVVRPLSGGDTFRILPADRAN
jgi:uncharacterized protein